MHIIEQNFNDDILKLSNIAIGGAQVPISIFGESFKIMCEKLDGKLEKMYDKQ
jgi:hypothetical protein